MDIRPFCGWRYKAGADGDISSLLAPPFDVLSEQDRSDLLASDRNIVAVDVPHFPPGEEGPDRVYADAARLLAKWQSEGVLVRDERPEWGQNAGESSVACININADRKEARVWVSSAKVSESGSDPIETVFHEAVHVAIEEIGLPAGAQDSRAEFFSNQVASIMALAYKKNTP